MIETQNEQQEDKKYTLKELFDETLARHLERLVGARYGINGLSVNLVTVSCLMILAEQQWDETDQPSETGERYSTSSLLNELSDLGFGTGDGTKGNLEEMIRKGYISVQGDGSLLPLKPTFAMTQLLERTFPDLPGMNLVAYLVQLIDEVESGRKDLRAALAQFDQTLTRQGVPLKRQEDPRGTGTPADLTAARPKGQSEEGPRERIPEPEGRPETIRTRLASVIRIFDPVPSRGDRDLVSRPEAGVPSEESLLRDQEEREGGLLEPSEERRAPNGSIPPAADPVPSSCETALKEDEEQEQVIERGPADARDITPEGTPPIQSDEQEPQGPPDASSPPSMLREETGDLPEQEERPETDVSRREGDPSGESQMDTAETPDEEEASHDDDTIIDRRVSAFQEDLAMECPICEGRITQNATSTGRTYFRCQNTGCNFISWGKPFHRICPECSNPFLVETQKRDGTLILKCPRATCQYWESHPSETAVPKAETKGTEEQGEGNPSPGRRPGKRKVVRRRVVRRKR